jgi:Ca2+-binding EF-hand superfamily protein
LRNHSITGTDGTITFEQFKRLYDSIADPTVEDLAEALKVFDKNEDGDFTCLPLHFSLTETLIY